MHLDYCSSVDKIIDFIPDILNKATEMMAKDKKSEESSPQTIKYTYAESKNEEEDDDV